MMDGQSRFLNRQVHSGLQSDASPMNRFGIEYLGQDVLDAYNVLKVTPAAERNNMLRSFEHLFSKVEMECLMEQVDAWNYRDTGERVSDRDWYWR